MRFHATMDRTRHGPVLGVSLPTLAAVLLAFTPGLTLAEAGNPLSDRFSFSVGGFLLDTSTDVRIDGQTRRGTPIDLEHDLGLGDTSRYRIDAYWRFRPRHKLRVMYFGIRQSESHRLDKDITVRDTTFPVSAQIDTHLDTDVAELAYEYAFLRRERYEVTGTVGIHNLRFEIGVSGTAGSQTGVLTASASASGPLPVVGLRALWRLHDRIYADAQAQFFKLEVDPYDGRLEDYSVAIIWQAFPRVGIGIGYNEFVSRFNVDDSRFSGRLRWRYGGARLFVTASF